MPRHSSLTTAVAVVSLVSLTLTACSSSAGHDSAGGSSSGGASVAGARSAAPASATIAYNGPEAHYHSLSTPKVKTGTHCRIGYQDIIASVPAQKAEQDAAEAEARKLGCSFIALDDQVNPTTQVNNFNQLVAQKVNAIIVFPIVSSALTPSLAKAKAAHVYVLGQSAPISADAAPIPGYATNMLHMSDTEAYLRVKDIAQRKPGATFVEMGLAAPVELLHYYADRTKYWAKKFGLKYLGEIDSQQDNATSYAAAMSAILGKYHNADAVFTFSDNSAVSAATVARTSGRSDMLISGGDGSKEAFDAIKAGRMTNTPQPDFLESGRMLVDAAYDLISRQNLPLPRNLGVPVTLITKDNVDRATPIG